MSIVALPVRSHIRNYTFGVDLDHRLYYFTFYFNQKLKIWLFNILDSTKTTLLYGVPLQSNIKLIDHYVDERLMPGNLLAFDTLRESKNADITDLGTRIMVLYVSHYQCQPTGSSGTTSTSASSAYQSLVSPSSTGSSQSSAAPCELTQAQLNSLFEYTQSLVT